MTRYAKLGEAIAILRALAILSERAPGGLRISEPSRRLVVPGSALMHLDMEFDRDEFWRIAAGLRRAGVIRTERLFEKHRGPGEVENIAQDRALEFFLTLERCANAGYEVSIVDQRSGPGWPSSMPADEHEMAWTVKVRADAFFGLRPHQY